MVSSRIGQLYPAGQIEPLAVGIARDPGIRMVFTFLKSLEKKIISIFHDMKVV